MDIAYDLHTLPTSQHRAGLAGLVVLTRIMQRLQLPDVPKIEVNGPHVQLALDEQHLVALFNYLYDATTEERRRSSRREKDNNLLRIEREPSVDKRGKAQEKEWYVYSEIAPRVAFLHELQMPDVWIKLWRELVWTTLRGVPKTRLPYEQRATGRDAAVGHDLWKYLQKWDKGRHTSQPFRISVAGSIYVGAMAKSAEQVPFVDTPDQVLLLHCWQAVMGVGEARRLAVKDGDLKEELIGYVINIPDVLDLEGFCVDFEHAVAQLRPEISGYRPRDAVFALPLEGGLQYLVALAPSAVGGGDLRFTVAGVDVFCLRKQGNTIPILAAGRVPADTTLVEQYRLIRGQYNHLLFREQLVRNVLQGRAWHEGFDRLFALHGADSFIGAGAHGFPAAVSRRLRADIPVQGGIDD